MSGRLPRCAINPTPEDGSPEAGHSLPPGEFSALIARVRAGDAEARGELFSLLYTDLRQRARGQMREMPANATLHPTALVHEAFAKMAQGEKLEFADRTHFLASASRTMRNLLVDHVRSKGRIKRDAPGEREPLDGLVAAFEKNSLDLEALDVALNKLAERNPEMAEAVELRFFGGLGVDEVAEHLGQSRRTFDRRWKETRDWLQEQVS